MSTHPFAPFMLHAAKIAERGRWCTAPNPTVGAVLVLNGQIVAEGWHQKYGGPHAEINCLDDARAKGINPADCTMVVTLEPCNHTGKTPPCSVAILESGIKRVIIGMHDPNVDASGGAAFLQKNGINVEIGIEEPLCRDLIADFLVWQQKKRPFVILKMASTIDGRIATRNGHSQWITGVSARQQVHQLRANIGHAGGVVLVGNNTLLTDNPRLTARDVPCQKQPLAAAVMSRLPYKDSLHLIAERPHETIFFTTPAIAASPRAIALSERGLRIIGLETWKNKNGDDLRQMLHWFRNEAKCNYVLCEGGGTLGLALLEAGLVDEFSLYVSPKILGDNNAKPLFNGRSPLHMDEALSLRMIACEAIDGDCHITFRPTR